MSLLGSLAIRVRLPPAVVIAAGLAGSSLLDLGALLLWVRLLTPAAFGTLSLVVSAALMVNALGFEWLRLAGARMLIDPAAPAGVSHARLAAWLAIAAGLAAVLAALTLALTLAGLAPPGLAPRWNMAILLLALSEMPFAAVTLTARLRCSAATYSAAMITRSALALGGGLLLLRYRPGSALGIVAATALAQLAVTLLVILRDPLWQSAIRMRSSIADRADLVRLGSPLIASSALALAAAMIDRTLIAGQLGVAAAGTHAVPAELVAKTLGFALMAINLSAYPLIVRLYERDGPAAAARALERNLALILAVGLPLLLGALLVPASLLASLIGRAAGPVTASLLPWLAAATLLRLLVTFHFAIAIQLARRMSLLLFPPLATLAILVPFARPMLAANGLVGFAKLLVVAQAAGAITGWWLARRVLPGRRVTPPIVRLAGGGLAIVLAALLLRPPG